MTVLFGKWCKIAPSYKMKDAVRGQRLILWLPSDAKVSQSLRWQSDRISILKFECVTFDNKKMKVYIDDTMREGFSTNRVSGPHS